MRLRFGMALAAAVGLATSLSATAQAAEITGAGSTFVYPVLSQWSADYSKMTGTSINYQSIGSGGGIAQIKAGTVTFGATDKPLSPTDLSAAGLAQFPVVIGAIIPVVSIPGIAPGQIKFTGPVLADIFLGKIKKWDDPEIKAINPGLKLPDAAINVVHRSDGSGTTFNFVHYLCQESAEWKAKVGEGTSVQWPTGIGGKGNEGVAAYTRQIPNSIGYVEYAYVIQNHMTFGQLKNKAGKFITPSVAAFQADAATANWKEFPDFYQVITDAPGPNAYPLTATTFVLMYKHPKDPKASEEALKFFKWSLEKGQPAAAKLDYVSLPAPLVKQIEQYWTAEIK